MTLCAKLFPNLLRNVCKDFFIRSTNDHLCQVIFKSAQKGLQRFFIRSINDPLCQVISKSNQKCL